MTEIKLNHLALVVADLDQSLGFWRDDIGLAAAGEVKAVPTEAVCIALLDLGDAHLELIQPTTDDSGVAKYLEKRGPGLHHVCLQVPDIEGKIAELLDKGYDMITETPRERDGKRYAFVHPKSTGGLLLELYELTEPFCAEMND